MVIKANLVIYQGTDFSATIDVVDSADEVFDLTNYTAAAQMHKNYAATTAYTFNCSDNNSQGQITLQTTSNTTATIDPGRYLYDFEITSTGGEIIRESVTWPTEPV